MPSIGVYVLDLFWVCRNGTRYKIQIISGTINAQLDNKSLPAANSYVVGSDAALQFNESSAKAWQIGNIRQRGLCNVGRLNAPVILFQRIRMML